MEPNLYESFEGSSWYGTDLLFGPCGATAINSRWLMTAASCVTDQNAEAINNYQIEHVEYRKDSLMGLTYFQTVSYFLYLKKM